MKNKEIAHIFLEISELLRLKNESPFRISAYDRASQAIESLPEAVEDIVKRGELESVRGIGESTAEKINEYLSTGRVSFLENLRKDFPKGLLDMMNVPGLGPKKAKILFDKLHIKDIDELKQAAEGQKIRGIRGFGAKTEENILKGVALISTGRERIPLLEALLISREIVNELKKRRDIKEVSAAGSLRRYKETIGDVDILCSAEHRHWQGIIDYFTRLPQVKRVLAAGGTKASILTVNDFQLDLRVVLPGSWGAALLYFTGSKEHNVVLRGRARDQGITINEYGAFKIGKKQKQLAGKTEDEMYRLLGLSFVPAPLRENRGEIEAAARGTLPKLVERTDIRGDIHIHSRYSDGSNTIEEMAAKAESLGYEWMVSTDHSQSLHIAHGLSIATLKEKISHIRRINRKNPKFTILCGVELDILADGSLDYPDEILKELDFVIASVHSAFKQDEKHMTRRIVKALSNPYVHCLGHPTGRLLFKRDPYQVNMEEVLQTAKKYDKFIEINASPDRLDLYDIYCKRAKELGIKLAIGTDSHAEAQMDYMMLGVAVAQRGWLTTADIINTLPYVGLMERLRKPEHALR